MVRYKGKEHHNSLPTPHHLPFLQPVVTHPEKSVWHGLIIDFGFMVRTHKKQGGIERLSITHSRMWTKICPLNSSHKANIPAFSLFQLFHIDLGVHMCRKFFELNWLQGSNWASQIKNSSSSPAHTNVAIIWAAGRVFWKFHNCLSILKCLFCFVLLPSEIPLRNDKLSLSLWKLWFRAATSFVHSREVTQSLPGEGEIQSCSIPPSWAAPGSIPWGCTFPDLTPNQGTGCSFQPCQTPWRQGLQTNPSRGISWGHQQAQHQLDTTQCNSEDVWAAKTSTGTQNGK